MHTTLDEELPREQRGSEGARTERAPGESRGRTRPVHLLPTDTTPLAFFLEQALVEAFLWVRMGGGGKVYIHNKFIILFLVFLLVKSRCF